MARIIIIRGDTPTLNFTITENSNPVSLVGATLYFTVKRKPDDDETDAKAIISKKVTSHVDAVGGITKIELTVSDTTKPPRDYRFDVQIKDSSGNITSTEYGLFRVLADITRRTT